MDKKNTSIRKAIFPVAGRGTRFLPATKASPKEMLNVVNKPLIQYAVEEAYASGIRQMIFVTCHNKNAIEDHFDMSWQLEEELIAQNKNDLLSIVRSVTPKDMECFYVRQPKPIGLGDAILCAEQIVAGEVFAVLLADDLMIGKIPILQQMINIYEQYRQNVIAIEEVPASLTMHYGIVQGEPISDALLRVKNLIEKPKPGKAPTNNAVAGRYILGPGIFNEIRALPKLQYGEIQLTDAIVSLLSKEPVLAYRYTGERYDCGSIFGFLKANVELGKIHPEAGKVFSQWLMETVHRD